jgi:MoaA/NifB/PqqE/SkfB family radical SAM enzyme
MQKSSCVWHLNRNCNFNCPYCYIRHFNKDQPGHGVKEDVEAFKRNDIDWQVISMSGGEPFIYHNFVELCKELTKFATIVIDTNCSTSNIYDFADTIDPAKVKEIHCSLHIGQRDNHDEMIKKILYLRERGFHVFVTQVMHPTLFDDYEELYEYFETHGILINPKAFEGIYHGKQYPQAYSEEQRRLILKYAEKSMNQSSRHLNFGYSTMVYGSLDWKGRKCKAGYNHFEIGYNGDAFRCHGDKRYLGNLYKGDIKLDSEPQICTQNVCDCEAEGWKGHDGKGYIHLHQSPKEIAKGYAKLVLSKMGFFK